MSGKSKRFEDTSSSAGKITMTEPEAAMCAPLLLLLGVVICFSGVGAQFPYLGECPEPHVQENFDIGKFNGTWYEIERTMSFLQFASTCATVKFSDMGDGTIEVLNEGVSLALNLRKKVRLVATLPDPVQPAKMILRLNDLSLHGNYYILKTDYDHYALVWSCNHVWLTLQRVHTENLWLLSRQRTLPGETKSQLYEYLEENGVDAAIRLLMKVKQSNCK